MDADKPQQTPSPGDGVPSTSRSIDWHAEGESRVVEIDGIKVVVHVVGRKGRRARIMIVAPAGAVFRSPSA